MFSVLCPNDGMHRDHNDWAGQALDELVGHTAEDNAR